MSLAAGLQQLMNGLRDAAVDPADAIRALCQIVRAAPAPTAPDPGVRVAQAAAAALVRRTALSSLSLACAVYRPSSSFDALAVRAQVCALFDAEILAAADAGERDVYSAFRALRALVSQDLADRGADLPALVTVRTAAAEPSLVLAWRLYQDARREPGLVARADVIHPLFVPSGFEALSF